MPPKVDSGGRLVCWALVGINPGEGLNPKIEQKEAGFLNEPIISEPSANGSIPAATAEAPPPLDPPAVKFLLWGFRVGPKRELYVWECRFFFRFYFF